MTDRLRDFTTQTSRPPEAERLFTSDIVESEIKRIAAGIHDEEIRRMFEQSWPNTLDTTTYYRETNGQPDTFIATGDIPAMWLRDSTNQVWSYLRYANREEKLQRMFAGLVFRQTQCVLIDPYANAFVYPHTDTPEKSDMWAPGNGWHEQVWERKYELDSLASFFRLSNGYYQATGDTTPYDDGWVEAVRSAIHVIRSEQAAVTLEGLQERSRAVMPSGDPFPAIPVQGFGYPNKHVGLSRNHFRPSDDEVVFPYLIPANAMAVVGLRGLTKLLRKINEPRLAMQSSTLAHNIDAAIKEHGVIEHKKYGKIYAYEVDGNGSRLLMDDPNVPSLLSLPYIGYGAAESSVYRQTRKFVTSTANPFYSVGMFEGLTSPHVETFKNFWPIATIMQIMTSNDDAEIKKCLRTLRDTHAGTYFIHESINVNNPDDFTRPWFGWANSLFGEMIVDLSERKPEILGDKI